MKSLTGISQGFDKCTKATLQNNFFWGMPANDCFCLETWSQYSYNVKCQKFKTILIWRSCRKMNRNKNLLILYYLWKKLFNAQKKVFHAFSFELYSTANSKFSFASLCEINCIKSLNLSLNSSKSVYFSIDLLCFIYFDVLFVIIRKKIQASWTFFSVARMKYKHVVLCNNWY